MSIFNPLVSIVIPVYNGANYMAEAIDSALAQTYVNCEVLVINDGSTDDGETERIALAYGDRIRYFSKPNGGVASALNLGIQEMRGQYFSWLSHDDVYLPNKVEAQIAFMGRNELCDAVIFSDFQIINSVGDSLGEVRIAYPAPGQMPYVLYKTQSMHGCALLIPKTAFLKAGTFDASLPTTQDYDLWLRMCRVVPFVHYAMILVKARQHDQQGSRVQNLHVSACRDFFARHLPSIAIEETPPHIRAGGMPALYADLFWARFSDAPSFAWEIFEYGMRKLQGVDRFRFLKWMAFGCLSRPNWLFSNLSRLYSLASKRNRLDFTSIFENNGFFGTESISGEGSTIFQTRLVRRTLEQLFGELEINEFLDVPCGDFHWMRHVNLEAISYIGGDIVEALVTSNQKTYGAANRSFARLDVIQGPLPKVDLILCRDCFVHLSFDDALAALRTIRQSGSSWLLTTTFTEREANEDLLNLTWRTLNLQRPPFNLPAPVNLFREGCTEGGGLYDDKQLGLWRIADI